jgi:hypothetical protein
MAAVNKIDSNCTGLRIAEELTIGVLPGTPIWVPYEPNSYDDFGGEITTVARNPINSGRQRQKGVVTDLDATGGFQSDLTATNLEDLLQGFFFADARRKGEEIVTAVDIDTSFPDEFEVASTTGFFVNDIIQGQNFALAANNGVFDVTAIVVDTSVEVADGTLAIEVSPPADAQIVVVGHRFAAGDLEVDAAGALPQLTTTTKDLRELGLIPGEWIFIGGDLSTEQFFNASNNGFARVSAITEFAITIDKADGTMITDDGTDTGSGGTALAIAVYTGRVLKNESAKASQVRRTYQIERELGAPDDALPAQIQGEYLVGSVANQITYNFNTADKVTADLSFISQDNEQVTGAVGLKSGTRPALASEDAYNTTSDVSRLRMNIIDPANENPTALFGFVEEFTIVVNNNVSPNKAIGTLGAFDLTAGQFEVSGSLTAFFSSITAVTAIRDNSDVTLDFALVKTQTVDANVIKRGVVVDLPLLSLGDGKLSVEQDEAIKIPISHDAGADRNFNHTLMMVHFDFLPDAADV